jgi:hypothetical protein
VLLPREGGRIYERTACAPLTIPATFETAVVMVVAMGAKGELLWKLCCSVANAAYVAMSSNITTRLVSIGWLYCTLEYDIPSPNLNEAGPV